MSRLSVFLGPVLILFCRFFPAAAGETDAKYVYLAAQPVPEQLIALTANVAAAGERGLVLLDAPKSRAYMKHFLKAYQPTNLVLVGEPAGGSEALGRALDAGTLSVPDDLWKSIFPKATEAVVCASESRRLLLQAACLAGAAGTPLIVLEGRAGEDARLRSRLDAWGTRAVHAAGDAAIQACRKLAGIEVRPLPTVEEVVGTYVQLLQKKGPIRTLVLANPADADRQQIGMSSLAPWIALQRRGLLLLTRDDGRDAGTLALQAVKQYKLDGADHIILAADLNAIPMERRANPLAGKDEAIELEPPVAREGEPFSYSIGRLFDQEPGIVSLILARQRLLAEAKGTRRALIVSNPGGGLPLLETLSRNTAHELRNAGYETSALFHRDVHREELRRLLPQQDIFLWEGHHSTLVADYGVPSWPEPLQPSLVFLQSCLALTETEAHPFVRRGAVAVVGAPSRTYSASGGAFTLAYFDALAYDRQTLGEALRQAKNFLLAYAQLKEKRLGQSAKLAGASVRSAWAFTLWGDPTLHLPPPEPSAGRLPPFRPLLEQNRITIRLPEKAYTEVQTEKYSAQTWPNGRLAGYLTKEVTDGRKRLLPLLFGEITFPDARGKSAPRLESKFPEDRWVFNWDARRGTGYLLVLPRTGDRRDIRFEVKWR